MKHETENSFFLKLMLIGAIVLLIVSGAGRHIVEHYASEVTEEIDANFQGHLDNLTKHL